MDFPRKSLGLKAVRVLSIGLACRMQEQDREYTVSGVVGVQGATWLIEVHL